MTRTSWLLAALGLTVIAGAGVLLLRVGMRAPVSDPSTPIGGPGSGTVAGGAVTAARSTSTLYCEFTNFADQNPRVGFYFAFHRAAEPVRYELVFQRERDGTQEDYGADARNRPHWALDAAESPAVLRAPDDSTAINLYDYDPARPGTIWFEAGLRSIRYLNLGGRCRLSST